jgi:hypothetical protein
MKHVKLFEEFQTELNIESLADSFSNVDFANAVDKAGEIVAGLQELPIYESSKFKKGDLVYNTRTKTVGIVRLADNKSGEVKTDADGNVDVDELEKYNPIRHDHIRKKHQLHHLLKRK